MLKLSFRFLVPHAIWSRREVKRVERDMVAQVFDIIQDLLGMGGGLGAKEIARALAEHYGALQLAADAKAARWIIY